MPSQREKLTRLVEQAVGRTVTAVTPVSGGDIALAFRVELDDDTLLFAKTLAEPPQSLFAAEARGLQFLGAPADGVSDGVPVPEVVAATDDAIVLPWIDAGPPTLEQADEFGRRLARTHAHRPATFGIDDGRDGYIGTLVLPGGPWESWPQMWREGRVLPYLRAAVDAGSIDSSARRDIESLLNRLEDVSGPPEPPARIHGDLWSGNVHWSAGGSAYLIDPAAHGGHRETDLAMLDLFGLPYLDRVLAAYDETSPLADGWRERVPLHQLHPVLVHAVLFGGSYGAHAASLARRMLRLAS